MQGSPGAPGRDGPKVSITHLRVLLLLPSLVVLVVVLCSFTTFQFQETLTLFLLCLCVASKFQECEKIPPNTIINV